MIKTINYRKQIYLIFAIFFLSYMLSITAPGAFYFDKFIFFLVVFGAAAFTMNCSFEGILEEDEIKFVFFRYKYQFALILMGIVVFFPFFSKGFFFNDDFWSYSGEITQVREIISIRKIQAVLALMFSYINPNSSWVLRSYMTIISIFLALLLFKWICYSGAPEWKAFVFSAGISYSSIMADCLGYLSINSFVYGLWFMTVAVCLSEMTYFLQSKKNRFVIYITIIWLVNYACHAYQLVLPFYITLFAMFAWFSKDKKQWALHFSKATFLTILGTIFHYVSISMISLQQNTQAPSRGMIINSLNDAINKCVWFFSFVLPNAINRVIACFTGAFVFEDKNYWYIVAYRSEQLKIIFLTIFSILILSIIVWLIIRKKIVQILIFVVSIPCSYFMYLLLVENGYHTYYAFALLALLIFYIYCSLDILFDKFRYKKYIIFLLLGIMLIQNLFYVKNGWVGTNRETYNYVLNTIRDATSEGDETRIHVIGTPSANQSSAYGVFIVETALKELGKNVSSYNITCSDSLDYITILDYNTLLDGCNRLTEEEAEKLKSYYSGKNVYNQCYLITELDGNKSLDELEELLIKSDLIPGDDSNAIIVDLSWVRAGWNGIMEYYSLTPIY